MRGFSLKEFFGAFCSQLEGAPLAPYVDVKPPLIINRGHPSFMGENEKFAHATSSLDALSSETFALR